MKTDILLLRPKGKNNNSRLFATEQLGLSYIAAYARSRSLSAEIIDGFLEPDRYDRLISGIEDSDYRVIGYPLYEETLQRVASDVARIRRRAPKVHITVGNHFATFRASSLLQEFPQFTSAIRGEGEQTLAELVQAIIEGTDMRSIQGLTFRENEILVTNEPRPNIENLDDLPFPARDTLPLVIAAGNAPLVYSSRGCNARCIFCSVHKFYRSSPGGMWRGRSPKSVVDEMEQLRERFGVSEFAFADEQFLGHGTAGKDRAVGIAEEIMRRGLRCKWYIETRSSDVSLPLFRKLRDSGLHAVFMGVESGYDPALKALNKGIRTSQHIDAIEILKELEILASIGFIMFRPETTIEELRCNLEFLGQISCGEVTALVTQLKSYEGTDLARILGPSTVKRQYGRKWEFVGHRVEECFEILMESADTLTASYNEFARVRRLGILTYLECLDLQRLLNSGPISKAQLVIDEIMNQGLGYDELRAVARAWFKEVCENFLRILWFTEAIAKGRPREEGIKLLSPMSLC